MTFLRLKQMSQILEEVSTAYDSLIEKKEKEKNKKTLHELDIKINNLRNQIVYLLTAIKKLIHQNG